MRRATWRPDRNDTGGSNFYPRSPCGERRLHNAGQDGLCHISIHALLAESDSSSPSGSGRLWVFLSTLSLRRATKQRSKIRRPLLYFYPRSPCGERPTRPRPAAAPRKFLSTLSLRRATHEKRLDRWPIVFLSTLSLRRATSHRSQEPLRPEFLSTLSLRRATGAQIARAISW